MIDPQSEAAACLTRRELFRRSALGLGAIATNALDLAGKTHHVPRARSVIWLHMAGSPSQLDTFDPKPALDRWNGKECPKEFLERERFAFIKGTPKLLASPHTFSPRGDSGAMVVDLLPHIGSVVDKLTIVRSMVTDQFNHAPAQLFLQTGSARLGRPSTGAWISHGLGALNRDLPTFVVMVSGGKVPSGGRSLWGSGFLPTVHQGVELRSSGEPVLFLADPPEVTRRARRASLDVIGELNAMAHAQHGDPETLTRIAQYELAYRMQMSVPGVCDLTRETAATLDAYGAKPGVPSFANHCLMARRLVEAGVRFVQLYDWGWDGHGTATSDDLVTQFPKKCRETDRPIAALIHDLDARGLLEETIVVWSGEFGRTPMNEERNGSTFLGRDHHPHAFSLFVAGGGFRRGLVHGSTDEFGYHVVEGRVHVHDLQATLLHQLGFDHERLTYRFQGRDYRLTDVHGRVVDALLS
ncbi:MAG: DUF1501 domain-containing protein [Planctomycetota bacterium]